MNSIDWLTKLIAFDTTSKKSNLELINCIQDWLRQHNIVSVLTYDDSGQKANLFATIMPHSVENNKGFILSGHTDVVPVDGQQWDTDPFHAVIIDDCLYGRGASDMKGFIAVVLALIPEFKKMSLAMPLHFAFSYDEEVGCLGVPRMIDNMQKQGFSPAACIVGEPTEMKPIVAHKGINVFHCKVYGLAKHSSLTSSGCNAIEYAAELIAWIKQYAEKLKSAEQDPYYDVVHTTITTNMISGGIAANIIPEYCEFYFEFRNLPRVDAKVIADHIKKYAEGELTEKMRKNYDDAKIVIDPICAVPGHEISEDAAITQLVRKLTNESTIRKVSYATEAGVFQQAGIPTLICGPGSIEQAHRANEYVKLQQLVQCENFLRQLVQ